MARRGKLSDSQIARIATNPRSDLTKLSAADRRAVYSYKHWRLQVEERQADAAAARAGELERRLWERELREEAREERRWERSLAGRAEARRELVRDFEWMTRIGLYEPAKTPKRRGKHEFTFTPSQARYIKRKAAVVRAQTHGVEFVPIPGRSKEEFRSARGVLAARGYQVQGRTIVVLRTEERHKIERGPRGRVRLVAEKTVFKGKAKRRRVVEELVPAAETARIEARLKRSFDKAVAEAGPRGRVKLVVHGRPTSYSYSRGQFETFQRRLTPDSSKWRTMRGMSFEKVTAVEKRKMKRQAQRRIAKRKAKRPGTRRRLTSK